jgi:hypothetical protein
MGETGSNPIHRPFGMFGGHRFNIVGNPFQGGKGCRIADISQHHAYIAAEPRPFKPLQGCTPEPGLESHFIQ